MRSTKIRTALAVFTLSAVALVGTACSSGSTDAGGDPVECKTETAVSIGSGLTGGVYYTIGVAMKKLIDDKLPCVTATVSSGNATDALRAKQDIVFTQTDQARVAVEGTGGQGFQPGEKFDYRAMAFGYDNASTIIVKEDFPGTKITDLKASDVIASTSSSSVAPLQEIFKASGGAMPKLSVIDNYDQLFTAIRQGQVTGGAFLLNHPAAPITEAATTQGLKALTYTPAALEKFQDVYTEYSVTSIPKGVYPFLKKDFPTWSRPLLVIVKTSLPKDVVEGITKLFYTETKTLVKSAPPAKDINIKRTQSAIDQGIIKIPWATGSKSYLESEGVKFAAAK